jgi:hypothetical protein
MNSRIRLVTFQDLVDKAVSQRRFLVLLRD